MSHAPASKRHRPAPSHEQRSASPENGSSSSFGDLGLIEPLLRALRGEEYTHPTPIQSQAIPVLLEGRDVLACSRTGTGKTAAFVLPILQRLAAGAARKGGHGPRALILVPTRELAAQVRASLQTYGRHLDPSTAVIHGGVNQGPQVRQLSKGVDILVATPGRLLDLMDQGHARLDRVEILVLDEADRMLDLGFLPSVKQIIRSIPARRQTLHYSATMPPAISALAGAILVQPTQLFVTPVASTVDEVDQCVHLVAQPAKAALLAEVLSAPTVQRALVFTRTKRGADRVARALVQRGIRAEALHGNKSQRARERALEGFRHGRSPILVATDIAARGLDVEDITHVVNYELPNEPESYVHRIGRTARAGAHGVAISFCSGPERAYLRDIERLIRHEIRVVGSTLEERPQAREHTTSQARGHATTRRKPARERRGRRPDAHGKPAHGKPAHGKPAHVKPRAPARPAVEPSAPSEEFGFGIGRGA